MIGYLREWQRVNPPRLAKVFPVEMVHPSQWPEWAAEEPAFTSVKDLLTDFHAALERYRKDANDSN